MTADPPIPADGSCATCGGPRQPERSRKYAGVHGETDPFCSVRCCRQFHGTSIKEMTTRVPAATSQTWARRQYAGGHDTGKEFVPTCGTTTAYKRGCRCDECKWAVRESKRRWRAERRAA